MNGSGGGNLEVALDYALKRGWPVLPIKRGTKLPHTLNGVKNATIDERTILHWWDRWPDAGIAIACGSPGPQVLDIDKPGEAVEIIAKLRAAGVPEVATFRGSHFYMAGSDDRTVNRGFGELRGVGSYAVAPPTIHESGKAYVWLSEPSTGLIEVPSFLTPERSAEGPQRSLSVVPALVPHGQRHDALKELAVDLLQCRKYDPAVLRTQLTAYAAKHCDPAPPMPPEEIEGIVRWAVNSEIAKRERAASPDAFARAVVERRIR